MTNQVAVQMTELIALEGQIATMLEDAQKAFAAVKADRAVKIARRDELRAELRPIISAALGVRKPRRGAQGRAQPSSDE